jgi:cytochrome c biogenesis protein ResB
MEQNNLLIVCCIVLLTIMVGMIGYILGKINSIEAPQNNQSFFKKNSIVSDTQKNNITIDDKKFVTNINTSGMEKKYDSLGDTKKSEENISESVNKLKNLKR